MKKRLTRLSRQGLKAQSIVLGLAVLAVLGLVAPIAVVSSGWMGLAAAATASVACLLAGIVTLAVCRRLRDSDYAPYAVLIGMLPRMGIPLALAAIAIFLPGPLVESGLLVYLVVFYLVTLGLETVMSLPAGGPGNLTRNLTS